MKFNKYKERPIRFIDRYDHQDWRLKLYSISAKDEYVPAQLVEAAKPVVAAILPADAITPSHYGIGFVILHEGMDGNYVLTSWWEGENMLCHHVWAAPADQPHAFKSFSTTGIVACVWELEILYFEKKAWSQTVLQNAEGPDFDRYLSLSYSGNV